MRLKEGTCELCKYGNKLLSESSICCKCILRKKNGFVKKPKKRKKK